MALYSDCEHEVCISFEFHAVLQGLLAHDVPSLKRILSKPKAEVADRYRSLWIALSGSLTSIIQCAAASKVLR
jgi:hypothetical protein